MVAAPPTSDGGRTRTASSFQLHRARCHGIRDGSLGGVKEGRRRDDDPRFPHAGWKILVNGARAPLQRPPAMHRE